MDLVTIWFILIAVLWMGYFILDGFDQGVGVLLPFLGRDDLRRRVMINTIGPVWDGNEVWLLVAGGATFAAFPLWYATMFSGYYLALFVILIALIVRGVAFEYRGKRDSQALARQLGQGDLRWLRSTCPALRCGVRQCVGGSPDRTDRGHPADRNANDLNYVGNFFDLLNPVSPAVGCHDPTVFTTHGAIFLVLKTRGEVRAGGAQCGDQGRPRRRGRRCGGTAVGPGVLRSRRDHPADGARSRGGCGWVRCAMVWKRRDGWAFMLSAGTIALAVASLFVGMFPNVMLQLDRSGLQPHGLQRLQPGIHPDDHDLGRGDHDPDRAGLPGLDLLGVPQADQHQHDSAATGRRTRR